MTPRQRALGALAVLLVVVAVVGLVALARGWVPLGPPAIPVTAYAPTAGSPHSIDATLDHGEFEVHGARYAAEVAGQSQDTNGGGFALHVHRIGGSGGRVALLNFTLLNETGAPLGWTTQSSLNDAGVLTASADALLPPGNHTLHAEATLDTYREAWIGVWHEDPLVLRFDLQIEATG